jgi:hypothetical protein
MLASATTAHLARPVAILPYVDGRSTCHFHSERETGARFIDGVLRLFQPDRDPGEIKPKRTYVRRTRYFARNELSRLCMDALRTADGTLLTTDAIAGRIIEAKSFDAADAVLRKAIGEQALTMLR